MYNSKKPSAFPVLGVVVVVIGALLACVITFVGSEFIQSFDLLQTVLTAGN